MPISVLQRNKAGNPASASTIPLAFGSNLTAGSTLIAIAVSDGATSTLSAISDSQGLKWRLVATIPKTSSHTLKVWEAHYNQAAADTVTVTTGFADSGLAIFEVAGLANDNSFDKFASQGQNSVTSLDSTNTGVPQYHNELLIGATVNTNATSLLPTVGAGYSNLQTQAVTFASFGTEEKINSTAAVSNATFGIAANSDLHLTAVFAFSDTPIRPSIKTNALRPNIFAPGIAR